MKFKLIVFDWDGTLMDSQSRIVDCMQAAAEDLKLTNLGHEAISRIIGLGLAEAVAVLYPDVHTDGQQQLVMRYRHHYLVENNTPSPLFRESRSVLEAVSGMGYLMAVATGKGRQGLDQVLDSTDLRPLFHSTRCADEAPSKPHPDMLLQLMDELGVNGDDTLMIGDTTFDMQLANNAGAHALAVSYGVHSAEQLLQHQPLGCLDDIGELPDWIAAQAMDD